MVIVVFTPCICSENKAYDLEKVLPVPATMCTPVCSAISRRNFISRCIPIVVLSTIVPPPLLCNHNSSTIYTSATEVCPQAGGRYSLTCTVIHLC